MKKIAILGSTGSIGTQTVDILPSIEAEVVALTTNRRIGLLEEQARALHPKMVCAFDENAAKELRVKLADTDIEVLTGMDGLIACASESGADIVVTAVVGMVGLLPTLAAIDAGKDIALANKETLVCAGGIVMEAAREKGVRILPVDSEHSAIFQCVQAANGNPVSKILLTASGGPFFGKKFEEMRGMTREQALAHPNWSMGAKITIDSATMMNKGLELIEAMWLYDLPPEDIEIVVHREHRALGRGICGRRGHRAARPAGYAPAHSARADLAGARAVQSAAHVARRGREAHILRAGLRGVPGAESRKAGRRPQGRPRRGAQRCK